MKRSNLCLKGKKCKGTCIDSNLNCAVTVSQERSRDLNALIALIKSGSLELDDDFLMAEGKRVADFEPIELEDKFEKSDNYTELWYNYSEEDDYQPYAALLRTLGSKSPGITPKSGSRLWEDKDEDSYISAGKIASRLLKVEEFDLESCYDESLNDPVSIATKVYESMGGELSDFKYFISPTLMSHLHMTNPNAFYRTVGRLSL